MKRDMECAMMDELVRRALEKGVKRINGYYYPTAKNGMVRNFYSDMGFEKVSEDAEGNTKWVLEVSSGYEKKNTVITVNGD